MRVICTNICNAILYYDNELYKHIKHSIQKQKTNTERIEKKNLNALVCIVTKKSAT